MGASARDGRQLTRPGAWPPPSSVFSDVKQALGAMRVPYMVAQMVKNLPAMQETQIQFLGWEDPLERGMATHSSILTWEIP